MRFTNEVREKTANKRIVELAGVRAKLESVTAATAARAEANLASHYQDGKHAISWEMGDADGYVTMEGPAALAVELGHHGFGGRYTEGTRILRDALGGG